jgi:tRNA dimethylallyltransferase
MVYIDSKKKKNKILVILGPTASGKSDLVVDLAKKFNGEVISADSRQVYKGLDIGSGKITKKEMKGVPHYLLDVVHPRTVFTVTKFQKLANKKINEILTRGKLPIVCGGTGFYIQSIVDGTIFPEVKPDLNLRARLETVSLDKLVLMLKKIDPERLKTIDIKNPRRLIRAIEIANSLGGSTSKDFVNNFSKWEFLQIGIRTDKEVLWKRIEKRFLLRVKQGIVTEAKKLHQAGLTYKRFSEIGLSYKYLVLYLQNKITKEEFIEKSIQSEQKYAKRQMTWFKRDKRIKWFELSEIKKIKEFIW